MMHLRHNFLKIVKSALTSFLRKAIDMHTRKIIYRKQIGGMLPTLLGSV